MHDSLVVCICRSDFSFPFLFYGVARNEDDGDACLESEE